MTRTTKQIKRMISKIHPTKEEVEKMSEYEWGFLVLPVKSFNLGRLDALKEEVENLQKLGLIKIKECVCFEHELMNDTYDLVYKRLTSIQEEIKLIEGAI